MEQKKITFDSFIRSVMAVIIVVGIVMLLNRLSSVLLPFFLAWLISYILFPLVKFFQYRCHLKFRIVGILCAFLTVGLVLTGLFWLMIPPMIEEGMRVKDLLVDYVSNDATMSNIPKMVEDYIHKNVSSDDIKAIVTQEGFLESIKQTLPKFWGVIVQSINVLSSVLTLTMVLLYTLFILLDYEEISSGWVDLLPQRFRHFAVQLVNDVQQGMNLYFVIGKAEIRPDESFKLGRIYQIMLDNPKAKIVINGHADSATGTPSRNQTLSEQRAQAVVDMLQKAGISSSRISFNATGSDKDASLAPESNRVAVCIVE